MLERWEILAGTPRELGLELEDQGGAADAVGALLRAGLIHRDGDGFIFATRQAIRFSPTSLASKSWQPRSLRSTLQWVTRWV
jgi:hypothetical protein